MTGDTSEGNSAVRAKMFMLSSAVLCTNNDRFHFQIVHAMPCKICGNYNGSSVRHRLSGRVDAASLSEGSSKPSCAICRYLGDT